PPARTPATPSRLPSPPSDPRLAPDVPLPPHALVPLLRPALLVLVLAGGLRASAARSLRALHQPPRLARPDGRLRHTAILATRLRLRTQGGRHDGRRQEPPDRLGGQRRALRPPQGAAAHVRQTRRPPPRRRARA